MYCGNDNNLTELKDLGGRNRLLWSKKSPKGDRPGRRNKPFSLTPRLSISRNGVQNYLNMWNLSECDDSSTPPQIDEKSTSQHTERSKGKKDSRNLVCQLQLADVNETQEQWSLSRELRDKRPPPNYQRRGDWEKSIIVMLGDYTARTMEFTDPVLFAFQILMHLEKVISKEEFACFSLPSNVSQLILKRDGRPLESMDSVMDGDVIWVTAKTSTDEEKEDFPNYNIQKKVSRNSGIEIALDDIPIFDDSHKKVTKYPVMEKALDDLPIFDDSSSSSSTTSNWAVLSPLRETPQVHIEIELSKTDDELKENDHRRNEWSNPPTDNFFSEDLVIPKKEEKVKVEDYRKENIRLENKVRKLKKHLERESAKAESANAAIEQLTSENCLLLKEIHSFEQMVESMSKSNHELELQLEQKIEERICTICCITPRDRVLVPCGHCFCSNCTPRFKNCPNCRMNIKQIQKIY